MREKARFVWPVEAQPGRSASALFGRKHFRGLEHKPRGMFHPDAFRFARNRILDWFEFDLDKITRPHVAVSSLATVFELDVLRLQQFADDSGKNFEWQPSRFAFADRLLRIALRGIGFLVIKNQTRSISFVQRLRRVNCESKG